MFIDCREYPVGYTFAEVASKALGIYVSVADFTRAGDKRIFRMIVDAELSGEQLQGLLDGKITDQHGSYVFYQLEAISGPTVDQAPRATPGSHYIRVTFM